MGEANEKSKANQYALATAICFGLFSVYKVIDEIQYLQVYSLFAKLIIIVEIAGYIGLTIASFIRNRKCALFATIACFCVKAYLLVSYSSSEYSRAFCLWFIAYTTLLVIILLSEKRKKNQYLWYIPGLLLVIRYLYICKLYDFDFGTMYNEKNWFVCLAMIIEALAFVFIGLWLKEESLKETDKM